MDLQSLDPLPEPADFSPDRDVGIWEELLGHLLRDRGVPEASGSRPPGPGGLAVAHLYGPVGVVIRAAVGHPEPLDQFDPDRPGEELGLGLGQAYLELPPVNLAADPVHLASAPQSDDESLPGVLLLQVGVDLVDGPAGVARPHVTSPGDVADSFLSAAVGNQDLFPGVVDAGQLEHGHSSTE